ncbi:MAG: response regulator [Candidatus Aureabacteria bacterium]|nr:response regulator [Candidatus Auribacterota bacterium]
MKKKILIVDDKVDSCDVLRDILTDDGYDTSASLSSRSALARIKKKKPDLVLLDIKMPGMDGIELLKRVKQRDKKIAVVMITAHADVDTAREAMKLGAFDYITKPYDMDLIKAVVREALLKSAPGKATRRQR